MADIVKGLMYSGSVCVAPVRKVQFPDQIIMFVQMEHRKGSKITFNAMRDRRAFEIVGRMISAILEKIMIDNRTVTTQERAYKILNTFSLFMGKKQHVPLCLTFEDKFPKLFNFEKCTLLFIDGADGSLFKFHSTESTPSRSQNNTPDLDADDSQQNDNVRKPKPLIVRLPRDRGITGISLTENRVVVVDNGDHNINYLGEVDNTVSLAIVKNCMFGPCVDT